jgi:tRNA (cmo5U34)-methyltransferase
VKKEPHIIDRIYTEKISRISDFKFDEAVAGVFPDMLNRSIPGYSALVNLIGTAAKKIVQPGSVVYDLGCSLGAVSAAVKSHCKDINYQGIAVDNSSAMINRCQELLGSNTDNSTIDVICDDVCEIEIQNASLVVLNFTLQFIPLEKRELLVSKIYTGLNPGGVFIVSEKIISEDPEEQQNIELLYRNFKRENGYSELEISQKREALENVLIPETYAVHEERLKSCGFKKIHKWFHMLNFVSIVAEK